MLVRLKGPARHHQSWQCSNVSGSLLESVTFKPEITQVELHPFTRKVSIPMNKIFEFRLMPWTFEGFGSLKWLLSDRSVCLLLMSCHTFVSCRP